MVFVVVVHDGKRRIHNVNKGHGEKGSRKKKCRINSSQTTTTRTTDQPTNQPIDPSHQATESQQPDNHKHHSRVIFTTKCRTSNYHGLEGTHALGWLQPCRNGIVVGHFAGQHVDESEHPWQFVVVIIIVVMVVAATGSGPDRPGWLLRPHTVCATPAPVHR